MTPPSPGKSQNTLNLFLQRPLEGQLLEIKGEMAKVPQPRSRQSKCWLRPKGTSKCEEEGSKGNIPRPQFQRTDVKKQNTEPCRDTKPIPCVGIWCRKIQILDFTLF